MPSFRFSVLAEKFENAREAIQSALVLFPEHSDERSVVESVWHTVTRDQVQDALLGSRNESSSFSSEETDGSGSFRSVDEGDTRPRFSYTPDMMYSGKILPNITEFDAEDDDSGIDTDTDSDSFYTSESSEVLAKALQSSLSLSISSCSPILASDGQCYSTILPPPPRRKLETRGKLVFVPSDAPGTCPIHGCAGDPCSTCKFKDEPMLFSF